MSSYVPRPGSKTEAAVNFLRTKGGQATDIQIAEAVDTERKNLPATLAAAISAGCIRRCDLLDGKGYALCGGVTNEPVAPKPPNPMALLGFGETSRKEKIAKPVAARAATKPKKKPPTIALPLPPAPKPAVVTVQGAPFRCGFFNDGSLRVEGVEGDLTLIPHDDDAVMAFSLSPNAAAALVDYVKGMQP